jgi:extracellular factor (EF) 3-hydroxypalmitic acid methyl ester biosynthesis protein
VLDGLFCSYAAGSPRVLEHFGAGSVMLGNFRPRNPEKEFMDYVLEWNLILRTEADMNRLFERSMFGKPCSKVQFEALGINLFTECSRD